MTNRCSGAFAVFACLLILSASAPAFACGPSFPELVFSYRLHPDLPLAKFAAGGPVVLRKQFARSYLVVAYRNLTGKPLSPAEQESAVSLWNARLGIDDPELLQAVKDWGNEQKRVLGSEASKPLPFADYAENSHYFSYLNCSSDSFRFALKNLKELTTKYGSDGNSVKQWVRAQNDVFCNCPPQYERKAVIPSPLPPTADPVLRDYRNYQIASANFYAENFDKATEQFAAIAKDSDSPFKDVAPYLVIRSMVRKATMGDSNDNKLLKEASEKLSELMKTTRSAVVKAAAPDTANFLKLKLEAAAWLPQLGKSLAVASAVPFGTMLYYYTSAYDTVASEDQWDIPYDKEGLQKQYEKLPKSVRVDDMTNWLAVVRGEGKDATDEAINRWNATRQQHWLVAALLQASGKDPRSTDLIAAATRLSKSSPAYLTANREAARLLIEASKPAEARTKLDNLLNLPNLPPSARNNLINLKLRVCADFKELANLALIAPAGVVETYNMAEVPEDFSKIANAKTYPSLRRAYDADAVRFFNDSTPLKLLQTLLGDPRLPVPLKSELLQAVWARAILCNNVATATSVAPALAKFVPSTTKPIASWLAAKTPAQRRFAAAYLLLQNPGISPYLYPDYGRHTAVDKIDDYQNNWWPPVEDYREDALQGAKPDLSRCLSESDRAEAAREKKLLKAVTPAADFLCSEVLYAAKELAAEPAMPHALHLAIRGTRFGEKSDKTTELSKKCYQLLHQKYASSPWAKKTKFWY